MRQRVGDLRNEREYFREIDAERIDVMRKQFAWHERLEHLAGASHIHDPTIVTALDKLGFDQTTLGLLFLVPLVQVAWALGSIGERERDHILAMADLRGIGVDTPGYERLLSWLERRPSDQFFEETLRVIAAVLSCIPTEQAMASKDAILLSCHDVAMVPCHGLGLFSRVCAAKRRAIEEIAKRLEAAF